MIQTSGRSRLLISQPSLESPRQLVGEEGSSPGPPHPHSRGHLEGVEWEAPLKDCSLPPTHAFPHTIPCTRGSGAESQSPRVELHLPTSCLSHQLSFIPPSSRFLTLLPQCSSTCRPHPFCKWLPCRAVCLCIFPGVHPEVGMGAGSLVHLLGATLDVRYGVVTSLGALGWPQEAVCTPASR